MGEEVTISYGVERTLDLFMNYGFVLTPHDGDTAKFEMKLNEEDKDPLCK